MAEGVAEAALRMSVEGPRAMLRPGSTSSLRRSQALAAAPPSLEVAAWAAAQQQAAELEAGVGPVRRRNRLSGLRKLLSKANSR